MNDVIHLPTAQPAMKKILILDDNFDILVLYKTLVSHNLANANQLARLEVYCCLIKPVLLTKLEETVTRALAEGDEPDHDGAQASVRAA